MADDIKAALEAYSHSCHGDRLVSPETEMAKYLNKLNKGIEKLSTAVKADDADREKVMVALESLIDKLFNLYTMVKDEKIRSTAAAYV